MLVTNRMAFGSGHASSGVMSTETEALPVASNESGRNPITICPSLVYTDHASVFPLVTLMSACPELGFVLAPAWGGGHVQRYGSVGPNPSQKPGAPVQAAR